MALAPLLVLGLSGCDQGHQHDESVALGSGAHVVGTNLDAPIHPSAPVELAFDRLLLPGSATRQTFILTDKRGNFLTPEVAYDPVARIVTVTPTGPFDDGQFYELRIARPSSESDPNGLRTIDGASLAQGAQEKFTFHVDSSVPAPPAPPVVDFCRDVLPIFSSKCGGSQCHALATAAAGLRLDSNADVAATAVGRVAQGANTGPRSSAQPPGTRFGLDMPLLDPGSGTPTAGDPGNSWLVYKVLMAVPNGPEAPGSPGCDGGTAAPVGIAGVHQAAWAPLPNSERAALAAVVPGREMPYPVDPSSPLDQAAGNLTVDELERLSRWIAQPRPSGTPLVPPACGCIQ